MREAGEIGGSGSTELPLVPSCALDAGGMREQRERYREASRDAQVLERSPRRLRVRVAAAATRPVPEMVAIETECCPFFDLSWDADTRELSFAVSRAEDEPALEAIAAALGVLDDQFHEPHAPG